MPGPSFSMGHEAAPTKKGRHPTKRRYPMAHNRLLTRLAPAVALVFASIAGIALADEASGKVVWVDAKHSNLLLECPDKGCPQIPNAKSGETYTFVVPGKLKKQVLAVKEGDVVKIVYEDA